MTSSPLSFQGLAADPSALNALRYSAGSGKDDKAALKEAAKQFESLFMRELIKSMREATQKSGLMDGEGSDLGTDLLDQQFAVQLSGLPGGLSEAIQRQLGQQIVSGDPSKSNSPLPALGGASTVSRNAWVRRLVTMARLLAALASLRGLTKTWRSPGWAAMHQLDSGLAQSAPTPVPTAVMASSSASAMWVTVPRCTGTSTTLPGE